MDEKYDYCVLGTGLKECIMSGLMSKVEKKKVLHMDRNSYYGGESASLNLEQLYKKFKRTDDVKSSGLGRPQDYSIDLCPKFLMGCGTLVKILLTTSVTRYIEFKNISGSYTYHKGKMHKVPATAKEALSSSLMGFMQKRRFKNFLSFVAGFDLKDEKTWGGLKKCPEVSSEALYKYWKLDTNTITFTGHAIALFKDDSYLKKPCLDLIMRAKQYHYALSRFGNSPYIYPMWGLGMLPEGFSRLCAIHGGVYMLNKPIEKIHYDAAGKVCGVESEGKVAKCDRVIADPSYFMGTDKIKLVGKVARCIVIMDSKAPFLPDTLNGVPSDCSAQMIFPSVQTGRKFDTYVSVVSGKAHNIAKSGFYVAVISSELDAAEQADVKKQHAVINMALRELKDPKRANLKQKFFWVTDLYHPCNDPAKDGCFISKSYDATTHFETATDEVLNLYTKLTGKKIDLSISAEPEDLEPQ